MSHPEERPSNEAQLPPYQQDWTTYSEREQTPASEPQMIIPSTPPPVEMSYTSPPPSDKPEPSGKDIGDTKAQSYDPMLPLEEFDLADLEQRFIDSMEVMGKKTEAIQKEWVELIEVRQLLNWLSPSHAVI